MKFLICGGLGFIGSNFTKMTLTKYRKDKVYLVDKLTYASNKVLLEEFKLFPNFKFFKVDICDFIKLEKLFKKYNFDYVINFAAETSVDKSFIEPELFFKVNSLGAINLGKLCAKYKVKRLHQVSTDEIYGDLSLDSLDSFKEDSLPNPKNPYSMSKLHGELALIQLTKYTNLDLTISRCSNNYGRYQHEDKLIPLIIKKALNDEKIPLYGDGTNIREWIHVLDHIEAIENILFNSKKGEIYNVGSSTLYSNLELTKLILDKLNKPYSLISFNKDRIIHDKKYKLDYTKISKELGYYPKRIFLEGILDTVSFYKRKFQ